MSSKRPTARLARALFAEPGHCMRDHDGECWRWDGESWQPVKIGDAILGTDRRTWHFWTGATLSRVAIEPGSMVRLDWHRDGLDWTGQLCEVVDTEQGFYAGPHDPALLLLVRPKPNDGTYAVVPAFVVELIAPALPGEAPSE